VKRQFGVPATDRIASRDAVRTRLFLHQHAAFQGMGTIRLVQQNTERLTAH
jgi:hypothetical protein